MSRIALSCLAVLTVFSSTAAARRLVEAPLHPEAPESLTKTRIDFGGSVTPASLVGDRITPGSVSQTELRIAAPSRAKVRKALLEQRKQSLAFFRAYYRAGVYPNNTFDDKTLNVWRDLDGHFCAAATIMVKSGSEDLAIRIADDNNFIKLGDVKQGPILDWILTTGFTQEEIAMIQKPFRPVGHNELRAPAVTTSPSIPVDSVSTTLAPMPPPDVEMPIAVVDAKLRKAETARLLAAYKRIDKQLVSKQKQNLERAVDRLMRNPALAWQLVNGS